MNKKYIIVNTGSTSKKYAFYEDSKKVYSAHFEIENGELIVTETISGESKKRIINKKDYLKAVVVVSSSLIDNNIINSKKEITCAAARIVAPGEYFLENKII